MTEELLGPTTLDCGMATEYLILMEYRWVFGDADSDKVFPGHLVFVKSKYGSLQSGALSGVEHNLFQRLPHSKSRFYNSSGADSSFTFRREPPSQISYSTRTLPHTRLSFRVRATLAYGQDGSKKRWMSLPFPSLSRTSNPRVRGFSFRVRGFHGRWARVRASVIASS